MRNLVLYTDKKIIEQKSVKNCNFLVFFFFTFFEHLDHYITREATKPLFVAFIIVVGKHWLKMICHMPC